MDSLKGKTIFITGASRGIGLAIAERAAQDGANITVAAKTVEPHPKLPGTIYTAADAIKEAGGNALAVPCDIRFHEQIVEAVQKTVATFGGIDICINNASAISLTGTLETPVKRFDLMHQVNVRGTFLVSQTCLPYLKKASNPHILTISPPLNVSAKWFKPHVAYTISKFGMSMCVLGMAAEFASDGIAVNALWPRTAIKTAAVMNKLGGHEAMAKSRKVEIMADAAHAILTKPARQFTGQFCIDDDILAQNGVQNFSKYADCPEEELLPDFFVENKTG